MHKWEQVISSTFQKWFWVFSNWIYQVYVTILYSYSKKISFTRVLYKNFKMLNIFFLKYTLSNVLLSSNCNIKVTHKKSIFQCLFWWVIISTVHLHKVYLTIKLKNVLNHCWKVLDNTCFRSYMVPLCIKIETYMQTEIQKLLFR